MSERVPEARVVLRAAGLVGSRRVAGRALA